MPPVKDGVIVGAGAVVRGIVPDYAVVAGNPGRVVRMRFDKDEIATLLHLAWWDWPTESIFEAMPILLAGEKSSTLVSEYVCDEFTYRHAQTDTRTLSLSLAL